MELFLDPDDERSRTGQLYDQLRDAIREGRLAPGDRISPSRTVAAELHVSRTTVTEAYSRLAAEGYIEGRAGGGSVVSALLPAPVPARPRGAGLHPTTRAAAIAQWEPEPTADARYDFRPGHPDPALFPAAAWRRALLPALDRLPGQYTDPGGTPELRAALAGWVTRSRGVTATAETVFVTSGAGHAVDLVARVLTGPGDLVAVEEPGYPPVVALLRSHGLQVVGVPVDDHGIVVDAIPPAARLVYVTPSHQFPLGMVMSRQRRLELLQRASASGAAVVEDDYDSEFRHAARPLEPLQLLDRDGVVLYVGTFSKSLSPGLRIGFLVAPPALLPALQAIRQAVDWCPPTATQDALARFIVSSALDRHLRRTRRIYSERHRLIRDALRRWLPAGFAPLPAEAGLHLTVRAPDEWPESRYDARLAAAGVLASSLSRTYQFRPPAQGWLLGYAGLPTPQLLPAARAFTSALRQTG